MSLRKAIGLVILSMCLCGLYAIGIPVGIFQINIAGVNMAYHINMLIIAVITLLIFKFAVKNFNFALRKKGFLKGISVYAIGVWIGIILNLAGTVKHYAPFDFNVHFWQVIIYYSLSALLVGVVEEICLRGCVFNILKSYFGDNRKGVTLSILISSILFSLMHLVGFSGELIVLIQKLIWTFSLGLSLGFIYYLSNNLWSVMLLHGLINLPSVLIMCSKNSDLYAPSNYSLIAFVLTGILTAFIFVLYSRRKEEGSEVLGA